MQKNSRETVEDVLQGYANQALALPTSCDAVFKKKSQATTEIWKNVDMIWAAANEVTERQLSACVTKRLNAQRNARQVLRAKDFITFCSNKRNQVNPTRQRLIEFYNKNSWNTEEDLKKVCNSRTLEIKQLLHCFKRLLE